MSRAQAAGLIRSKGQLEQETGFWIVLGFRNGGTGRSSIYCTTARDYVVANGHSGWTLRLDLSAATAGRLPINFCLADGREADP